MQQKKTKVLHIITRLDIGGSSENVISSCQGLTSIGYDVSLIYGYTKDKIEISQIRSCYIPELSREVNVIKDLIALIKIINIIKKEKFEIVHTHTSKAGFLGRIAAKIANVKIIVHTPHGHVFYGYFGKLKSFCFLILEKIASFFTSKLVALTENEKVESIKFGIGNGKKWAVIHSGVEYEEKGEILHYAQNDIKKESFIIGTVSRLEPVKGVIFFVKAAKIVTELCNFVNFLVVGDGSERKKIEDLIEKLGLKEKFTLVGAKKETSEYISKMDIYVQPSLNEGMGKTLIQAQLLKKPVVATDVCGIPNVVVRAKSAILVKPRDEKQLAEGILKLIKDKSLRERMGLEGYMWVTKRVDGFYQFSIERMIFLLDRLYKELIAYKIALQ